MSTIPVSVSSSGNASLAPVKIRPVRGLLDFLAFCRLPRKLYQGMPGFSPPLDVERWTHFSQKLNPNYRLLRSQKFLAERDGALVGRIEAQIYRDIQPIGASAAQFGALDAIKDQAVVKALTDAAEAWLMAQGAQSVNGPYTPSVNGESGLLVQGFEAKPMCFTPWQPAYLGGLLEQAGYSKARDLYSYRYDITLADRSAEPVILTRPEWRDRLVFRGLDFQRLDSETELMRGIFNDGWRDNWGYAPLSQPEMKNFADTLKHVITDDLAFICMLDGEPVAFGLIIPNIQEIVGDLGGKISLFGLARVIRRFRQRDYKSARLILFGLSKKLHRSATGGVIILTMIEVLRLRSRKVALDHVEFGWVLEDNVGMRRPIEMSGAIVDKVHRIYAKQLGAPPSDDPTLDKPDKNVETAL